MANSGSVVRKDLHDLSKPIEIRELNRQLDWIWKQLLGGLTLKSLSSDTTKKIMESSLSQAVIEQLIADKITANTIETKNLIADSIIANNAKIGILVADEIRAGSIDANFLYATLAEMMVAKIGVAKIDYASIVDAYMNRLFVDVGSAGKFTADKLLVYDGNIVDLNAEKITAGEIDASKIKVINLDAGNITVGAINGQMIAPGSIIGDSIRAGSIDDTLLANGCINADKLAGGSVVKDKLALASVSADKLAIRQHVLFGDDYKLEHRAGETNTQIAWSGLSIQYNGASYPVQDGSTNASYVFWKISDPSRLYVSNAYPELGADDCLVYINKNGVALTVPGATTLDGSLIVPGTITADAIAANSITGDRLAAYTVQAGSLAAGSVFGDTIAAGGVSAEHLAAGSVTAEKIAAGAVTAETLAVQDIMSSNALVGQILAKHINVDDLVSGEGFIESLTSATAFVMKLFSNEAFIDLLRTTAIVGDESIKIIAERASKNFRQETMPVGDIKPGDTWCIPSTGETYQAEDMSRYGLAFELDGEGNLHYSLDVDDGSITVEMQGYDLTVDGILLQCDGNGDFLAPIRWMLVQDSGMMSKEEFRHYVRIATDGLHVGAEGTTGEVVIDHDSVDIVLNGQTYSTFASNHVAFGNYQLRKTADGGLAFKMR